ncbi:MAG: chemotaxis protein CheW [Deltaproteobacteria bacterium]|nr:MAG: chemotaxis protein CheW [Deltaproteobacteria bacterium]
MTGAALVTPSSWCTFVVGDGLYGIELPRVQEVLRPLPLTRVPLAPPAVVGLLNLRGQIVPAVDLRTLLRLPPRDAAGGMVVVRGPEGPVALVVDLDREPANDPLFAQALALPERLLVVLDLDPLLDAAFARPAPRFPGD